MRSQIALLAYGSTPAVGSSSIMVLDPPIKAMATDNFLCIPPDRQSTVELHLADISMSFINLQHVTLIHL